MTNGSGGWMLGSRRWRRLLAAAVTTSTLMAAWFGGPGGIVARAATGSRVVDGGPSQRTGSAAGRSHTASAQATQATGARPGGSTAVPPGALPPSHAYAPVQLPKPAAPTDAVAVAGPGQVPPPKAFDPVTSHEVASRRTEREQTFANADGTLTTRFYRSPISTRRPDGTWAPIDPSLHPLATGGQPGGWQAQAGTDGVTFAATAAATPLVQLTLDASHSAGYGVAGASASAGQANGSTVTYAGVLPHADLRFSVQGSGVEELLVLGSPAAPSVWTFPLQLQGLKAAIAPNGDVALTDSSGAERVRFPHGTMTDSNVDPNSGDGQVSDGITYSLVASGGVPALRVQLDAAWLQDPARRYPVMVDPSVTNVNSNGGTYVMSPFNSNNSTSSELKVGTYDGGTHVANSFMAFGTVPSQLNNEYVLGATLFLYETWSWSCQGRGVWVYPVTQPWSAWTSTTYPGPTTGASIAAASFAHGWIPAGSTSSPCPAQWEGINLGTGGRDLVEGWTHGQPDYGLALKASTTDDYGWKKFASSNNGGDYLAITYTPYGASYAVSGAVPNPVVTPIQDGATQVTVTNLGVDTWTPINGYRLGYHVYDYATGRQLADGPLTAMPASVAPRTSVTVNARLGALPVGKYVLAFDMNANGTWFSTAQVPPAQLVLTIPPQPPVIDAMSPLSGYVMGTLTPELSVSGRDLNSATPNLTYDFELCDGTPAAPTSCLDSGRIGSSTWVVPAGSLRWSHTYFWSVTLDNGAGTTTGGPSYVILAVPQPTITSHLSVSPYGASERGLDPQVGNFTTAATDASVTTMGPDLTVKRTYNSLDPRVDGMFGAGWTSRFDMLLTPDSDGSGSVVIRSADGLDVRFGQNPDGTYAAPEGRFATLTPAAGGGWTLADKDRTVYAFDGGGRLTTVTDRDGRAETFAYSSGRLVTVTNTTSGRSLHFTWTGSHVTSVATDSLGTAGPLTWTYTYSGDQLAKVCSPTAACTTYTSGPGSHYRSAVLDSAPSSYWRMGPPASAAGTPSGVADLMARGNPGTWAAGPFASAPGLVSGDSDTALEFDGSSAYVSTPSLSPLQAGNTRSVELWFSTTSTGQQQILDAGSVGNNGQAFLLGLTQQGGVGGNPSTNTPGLYLALWNADFYLPGLNLADGKAHQVVVTLSGTTVSIYVDGATPSGLVYSAAGWSGTASQPFTSPLTPNTTANPLWLGHARYPLWNVGSAYFNGTLDEVSVYNHVLSTASVQAHRAAGAAYQAFVQADGPYAYYRLHETAAGSIGDVVSRSNAASWAGPFASVPGLVSGDSDTALQFDGSTSYASTPLLVGQSSSQLTVEAWFKLSALPASNARLVANSHSDVDFKGFQLGLMKGGASGFADVGTGSGHIWAGWNQQLTVGTVYHYAMTYDGTTVRVYLNGILVGSGTGSGPMAASPLPVMLGRDPAYDGGDYFGGTLDEVAVYGSALPQSRLQAHETAGAGYQQAVLADNPSAYYRLDETLGASEVDLNQGQDVATYHHVGQGAGALGSTADPAATFDGTSSVALPDGLMLGKTYLAIEVWFKTTATGPGVLWSSTFNPLGGDPYAGRFSTNLYVDTGGYLNGLLWVAGKAPMRSSQPVNDGTWHHAVLSGAGTVQSLYVDGALAGSLGGQIDDTGLVHEYLGAGIGVGQGISHFNGSIDEVAFYDHPLGQPAVQAHYNLRVGSSDLAGITLPSGKTRAAVTYDVAHDRVSQLTDADGGTWKPSTPAVTGTGSNLSRVVTVTDPMGNQRSYGFDPLHGGRILSASLAAGQQVTYGYDTGGFQASVTDQDGHSVTSTHDARGNVLSRTTCRAAGSCFTGYSTYFLNPNDPTDPRNDQVTGSADGRSSGPGDTTYLTTYTYAANGNLASTTTPATPDFPSGRTTTRAYTTGAEPAVGSGSVPAGLLASVTDARGGVTSYAYAANGDLKQVTDPVGLVTTYDYDPIGRVQDSTEISDSFPGGLITAYAYDGLSHLTSQLEPTVTNVVTGATHGRRTDHAYDADGNVTTTTVSDTGDSTQVRTTTYTYDAHDLLASVTDPAGGVSSYAYDAMGKRVRYVDAGHNEFDYTFNTRGQVLTRTLHASTDLVLESDAYDPAGRLASHTDAMGRTTAYTYFDDNTLASATLEGFHNPDGSTRDIVLTADSYDGAGNLVKQVTGGGLVETDQSFDAAGRLASTVLDPAGLHRETDYTYDATGDVITASKTAAGSAVTEATDYGYDADGRNTSTCVRNGGGVSLCTTVTRDRRGLPVSVENPRGSVPGATASDFTTEYLYDAERQPVSVTGPPVTVENDGVTAQPGVRPVTRTGYDAFGDAAERVDPLGNVTRTTYDGVGRPTSVVRPTYTPPGGAAVTPTIRTAYDALGNVTATTDALGRTTSFTYDALGNRLSQTDPLISGQAQAGVWSYTHDALGELLSSTDPAGARTKATYDDLGRQATSTIVERRPSTNTATTPQFPTTVYGYDDAGNRTSILYPSGWTSTTTYDAAGDQLVSTPNIQRPAEKTTSAYDLAGRLARVTSGVGTATTYAYDLAGRLTSVSDLDTIGNVLRTRTYGYDAAGNQTSWVDATGLTTTYAYDAADQLTSLVEPVDATHTITTSFGYDAAGHRTRVTDGLGNPTVYTYNALGLQESVVEPSTAAYPALADRTYTSAYDAGSNLSRVTEPGGVARSSTYDELGRLVRETGSGAQAPTADRVLGYDLAGRLISASAPGGTDTYTYDDRGDLLTAAGPSGSGSFTYDFDGNMASRADAGGSLQFTFSGGRLAQATDVASGNARTYGYDNAGRLSQISAGLGAASTPATLAYGYDALGRLTSQGLTGPVTQTTSFAYDAMDRLTSRQVTGASASSNTYAYDGAGRLTSWTSGTTTTTYAWDAAGNRVRAGSSTATYDTRNRLLSDGTTTYAYTARGTLASRTVGGSTRPATSDAFDRLASDGTSTYSYDGLGRVVSSNGTALGYADQTNNVVGDASAGYGRDPSGALRTVAVGGVVRQVLTDPHGDLLGTYGPAGLTDTATYDPFGQRVASSGTGYGLGYQGGWTDASTGQVDMAARWYDPASGRFDSRDSWTLGPIPSVDDNRYVYAGGDPVSNADPSGHMYDRVDEGGGCSIEDVPTLGCVTRCPTVDALTDACGQSAPPDTWGRNLPRPSSGERNVGQGQEIAGSGERYAGRSQETTGSGRSGGSRGGQGRGGSSGGRRPAVPEPRDHYAGSHPQKPGPRPPSPINVVDPVHHYRGPEDLSPDTPTVTEPGGPGVPFVPPVVNPVGIVGTYVLDDVVRLALGLAAAMGIVIGTGSDDEEPCDPPGIGVGPTGRSVYLPLHRVATDECVATGATAVLLPGDVNVQTWSTLSGTLPDPPGKERLIDPVNGKFIGASGHLISDGYGGSRDDLRNFVPLYRNANSLMNTRAESKIRSALWAGKSLTVEVWPVYGGPDPAIPSAVRIKADGPDFHLDCTFINTPQSGSPNC